MLKHLDHPSQQTKFRHDAATDLKVARYLDEIKAAQNAIAECEQKLKDLRGVSVCPACGAEVGADSMFCPSCGNRMHTEQPKAEGPVCPNCGAPIAAGSKFCTSCGVAVDEQNVKPQDDSTQE